MSLILSSQKTENSRPNAIPLLMGLAESEMEESGCTKNDRLDDCPLIYRKFAQAGFRTSSGHDASQFWHLEWEKRGFKVPPTDYYLRAMARVSDGGIANDYRGCCPLCWGPQLTLQSLVDYMKAMAVTMGRYKRYIQMTWSISLTHEDILYGSLGERVVLDYLKWMREEGYLNQTIFVFMSDHGAWTGGIRQTPQGKIESNMPFLYLVVPEWFRRKYPLAMANLRLNSHRLTTHFDTHETFLDILDLTRIEGGSLRERMNRLRAADRNNSVPRGISLFLPIPKSRTCEMAGIDKPWCSCDVRKPIIPASRATLGAEYAVSYINNFISNQPEGRMCSNLTLQAIKAASVLLEGVEVADYQPKSSDIYEIEFETSPANATFEAVVMWKNGTREWSISGGISRTNPYGKQSHCVRNSRELKKYCHCVV